MKLCVNGQVILCMHTLLHRLLSFVFVKKIKKVLSFRASYVIARLAL